MSKMSVNAEMLKYTAPFASKMPCIGRKYAAAVKSPESAAPNKNSKKTAFKSCVIGFGANAAAHSASDSNSVSGNKTTPGSAGSRAESPNTPPSTEASKSLFPVSGSRKKRRTALSKSASM